MGTIGNSATPVEKVLADTVEASTYIGLPAGGGSLAIVTGTELDTGDTLDGSAIYVKMINFGTMPNAGTKNVAHGITTIVRVIDLIWVGDDGAGTKLTFAHATGLTPRVFINNTNIGAITTNNWTAYSGFVLVKYTKV
jgi:hypothetical protein